MQIYMYVHTRERVSRPGFDGVKIKLLLLLLMSTLKLLILSSEHVMTQLPWVGERSSLFNFFKFSFRTTLN